MIQQQTASWLKYIIVAASFPALIPTIIYGSWSDKLGRKPVMWLPLIGNFLRNFGLVFVSYYIKSPIYYMIIISFVTALFGHFPTILSCTMSYVSDLSDQQSRTKRVVILESMLYVSGVIASLGSGYVLQYFGYVSLYVAVCSIVLLLMVYMLFLKESYKPQTKVQFSQMFSFGHFVDAIKVYSKTRAGNGRSTLLILTIAFTINFACRSIS